MRANWRGRGLDGCAADYDAIVLDVMLFATFALRAGVSTFDLSRYMGASLTMIDRHYGHLARDGRDHALNLLDTRALPRPVSTAWTSRGHFINGSSPSQPTKTAHSRRKPVAL